MSTSEVLPTQQQADAWLKRWDEQQEFYMPDREERFAALVDVLEEVLERPDPLVVDLGIGPGSLAHRLVDRIPGARVVGADADPLLLRLGEIARPDDRIRTVLTDLRSPDWLSDLDLDRTPDAYVSSTALHWMDREPLRALISVCGANVAAGGLFLDADHLYELDGGPRLDDLGRALTQRRKARVAVTRGDDWAPEDWAQWWDAVEAAPELAGLVAERAGGFVTP